MVRLFGLVLRTPQLVGLDVGTTTVKAARIRRKGTRVVVAALAETRIDPEGHDGNSRDERVSSAIRQCLCGLKGRTDAVASGLSGPDVTVRTFDFPPLSAKQLASAVELEAAQVCPFDVSQSAVAYDVPAERVAHRWSKKNPPQRTTGVFAAAKNDAIQVLQKRCTAAGTHCVLIDVEGLALLNCLEACGALGPERVMTLNVGSSYTNLAILSDDGQPFVRDIAYAGDAILNHLSQSTGAPRQAVVNALEGAESPPVTIQALRGPLEQACAILAERVLETVRYYGTRQSGSGPDKTFLCGGLVRIQPVVDVLVPLLSGKVELWNPLATLPCARGIRKSGLVERGPAFAVALGLALRSLRDVQD